MKIIETKVFKGKNIYSYKKCMKVDVDLEGYSEIPSKDIEDFNDNIINMIPELNTHRCGIDEERGFVKRLIEGTYLAHICEHMAIAIQNKIGIDVHYGKAREVEGDHYYIICQYIYEEVGIESIKLAVDIINALINKIPINYDERIELLKCILRDESMGPSTKSICDYAQKIGLPVISLGSGNFHQIGYGKQGRIIEASIGANTNCVSVDISCDKLLTKELLSNQGIPVAKGLRVKNIIDLLRAAEEIGYPVVLKPQYGNQGKGVVLNIKNEKELLNVYKTLKDKFKNLMIEKYYKGNDFRVCVVNYKVVAASRRMPPYVEGNGINTVIELIDKLNQNPERGEDHEKYLTKIKIDEEVIKCINEQGKELDDILTSGETIFLRKNANLSTGGEAIDYTDEICEENINLCIRTAKTLNLDICGIDICAEDISKPIYNSGIIMEVNAAPGLRMHLNPSKGISRDIGKEIVNMLYNDKPHNIPVVSITGTNGKTTTTRVISHTLSKMGYCVGMTSTSGIYINDECIDSGDDTGFESAKSVLLNRDVDVAVLETARGGIIKKGLAYDLADVAVITNIREDHLGIDGINSMEELCYVKSLVGEVVKEDGYVVLNADDYWSKSILNRIKANIIFFSKDSNNPLLKQSKISNISVYLENDDIVVSNNGKKYVICGIKEVPITLDGKLSFNIENTLAICGALVGMGIDYCMIKNGITTYLLNSHKNSGRFNCYDVNGINVILDYGHNVDGYNSVLSAVKEINNGMLYGVIGIPGDRSNETAKEIGRIASKYLDYSIVKEDKDLRGRKQGEIAQLIVDGMRSSSDRKKYEVILREEDAFEKALNMANSGDTVIVFFEDMKPLVNIINKFSSYREERNISNI
ncbi:cyanophycin synthetase [Clostridium sp. DSM 100503]|uniref:cyanophycin synthetase n=1 Tax=Clostridium sp. DSM 100503 TaxID=2963282 RepID=UPI002149FCE1|nr:cyanophycin synthetase [Clostridium sp. DSM 100503]MCR1951734.1 cyanophycin synthetase [Clostridium sp. DSM 100503]